MHRGLALILLLAGLVPAATAAEKPSRWHTAWRVSQVLLAGADVADLASSWGKSEANPLVRTGSRFSYGSLAIKLGVMAGGLAAQSYAAHKNPRQVRLYTAANLAAIGVFSAVAAHNMNVPAAH